MHTIMVKKVIQETRGWDEIKGKTFSQRVKESANDYRYFPDPDLPKLDLEKSDLLSRLKEEMPTLPDEKRVKYKKLGLTIDQIEIVISQSNIDNFFIRCANRAESDVEICRLIANYLITDLFPTIESTEVFVTAHESEFVALMQLLIDGKINSRIAKDILVEVVIEGKDPLMLVTERGLMQSNSEDEMQKIVLAVIAQHPTVVAEYKAGKLTALQFLLGQGMKLSRGSANPKMLTDLLKSNLG